MTPVPSLNTRAILLLTAPLIAGRGAPSSELLSPGEYKRLARHLREIQREPADLVAPEATSLISACSHVIDEPRLQRLLGRGFLLSQALERWQSRAIWVVSRADAEYPRRLKSRLRDDSPAVVYGCGDMALLDAGGLAVVGSRHVDDSLVTYTTCVGRLAAEAGMTIISGGAKGVDQAAMRGALEAGGMVGGVLADSLEKTVLNREQRNLLLDGRLVLISPYDPGVGFNVGNAMQRNKLIYALADASLVVNADLRKGGTWAGAIEQLDRLNLVPVYVRSTGAPSVGLDALLRRGAHPWPNPEDAKALRTVLAAALPTSRDSARLGLTPSSNAGLSGVVPTPVPLPTDTPAGDTPRDPVAPTAEVSGHHVDMPRPVFMPAVMVVPDAKAVVAGRLEAFPAGPSEALFAAVRREILALLNSPLRDAEVAAALGVVTGQARVWLQRLVDEGAIEKRSRPAGYIVRQSSLFE